jgi:hypothetical protein
MACLGIDLMLDRLWGFRVSAVAHENPKHAYSSLKDFALIELQP